MNHYLRVLRHHQDIPEHQVDPVDRHYRNCRAGQAHRDLPVVLYSRKVLERPSVQANLKFNYFDYFNLKIELRSYRKKQLWLADFQIFRFFKSRSFELVLEKNFTFFGNCSLSKKSKGLNNLKLPLAPSGPLSPSSPSSPTSPSSPGSPALPRFPF